MKNRVVVDINKVVGSLEEFSHVVNLSSLPHGMISTLIATIPNIKADVKVLDLYPKVILMKDGTYKTAHFKGTMKKRPVTFIVDEDDKSYDIKIKNVSTFNRFIGTGIIEIKRQRQNRRGTIDKNGKIIRVGNHHHTNDTFKILSLTQFSAKKASTISFVTIVSTKDDRAGSIAGLTYAASISNVKFEIEKANVAYSECWLTTSRKYVVSDMLNDKVIEGQTVKLDDKYWNYKTGYGDHIMSDKGVHKLNFDFKQKKKEENNWIDELIKMFVSKISGWISALAKWFKERTNKKDKSKG